MQALRAFFLVCLTVLAGGCAGYFTSTRPNSASFAGAETFGESSKLMTIDFVELAVGSKKEDVSRTVSESLKKLEQVPPQSKALVYADLGIIALYANDWQQSSALLKEARLIMGNLTASDASTAHVKSLGGSETDKVFKGEPHERTCLYLYSGLAYLAENDTDNALASFKAGVLEDAMARDDKARGDWLSIDLLSLECKRQLGIDSDYKEWISYIKGKYKAEELPLGWDKSLGEKRTICVVMVGPSPEKIAGQSKGEKLQYWMVESQAATIRVSKGLSGSSMNVTSSLPVDDCYVQATTRGHRGMDTILTNKANVRSVVEATGNTITAVAPLVPFAGPLLMFAREVSWNISDKIDSSADHRQMRMMPGKIFLLYADFLKPGDEARVEVLNKSNKIIAEGKIVLKDSKAKAVILLAQFPY